MHNRKETCLQNGDRGHVQRLKRGHDSAPREKLATPLGVHDVYNLELTRAYMHNYFGN
jgi:hypothetical protein